MYQLNKLHELVVPWFYDNEIPLSIITDLKLNSREIVLGNLFIAIKGYKSDGRWYIENAIRNGAIAVLSESYNNIFLIQNIVYGFKSIPIIYFNKLNQFVSSIAGRFYGDPSFYLKLIGVTGTNGKTSITHVLANWVELLGEKSAIMGTLGNGELNNIKLSYCTTCSAIDIQKTLNQFVQSQIKFVAMEVSSHGLDQHRVDALYFDVAIFSNLSHDHLDYHNDINTYAVTKWRLFNDLNVKYHVINIDDYIGYKWLSHLHNAVAVTMKNNLPQYWSGKWVCLVKANYSINGTDIIFKSSWGDGRIHSQLLGFFNVSNLLLALGALLVIGYSLKFLLSVSSQLRPICGRLEVLRYRNHPIIIVDYAHTPDALKKVLIFARQLCQGKIWCIFGCGGNRDRYKRSLMGMIAEQYSNHVIITNDNPRTECPEAIVKDIIYKIKNSKKIRIIIDRIRAIKTAIFYANSEDFILILGKGNEQYQIIGQDYIKYSDQNIVTDCLLNL